MTGFGQNGCFWPKITVFWPKPLFFAKNPCMGPGQCARVRIRGPVRGACLLPRAHGGYAGAGYMAGHVSTAAAARRRCRTLLTRLHCFLWSMGPDTTLRGLEIPENHTFSGISRPSSVPNEVAKSPVFVILAILADFGRFWPFWPKCRILALENEGFCQILPKIWQKRVRDLVILAGF